MSNSWGCMLLMDWKSESTALSLVMLRPRMWLLFIRLRKVVTAFCRAFRNCSWFSSDSPFWYCCWRRGQVQSKAQKVIWGLTTPIQLEKKNTTTNICSEHKFQHTSTMLTGWTVTWLSTGWLIAGRGSASGTGAGAEGVGLLRVSSCFFSQYVLFR